MVQFFSLLYIYALHLFIFETDHTAFFCASFQVLGYLFFALYVMVSFSFFWVQYTWFSFQNFSVISSLLVFYLNFSIKVYTEAQTERAWHKVVAIKQSCQEEAHFLTGRFGGPY